MKASKQVLPETTAEGDVKDPRTGNSISSLSSQEPITIFISLGPTSIYTLYSNMTKCNCCKYLAKNYKIKPHPLQLSLMLSKANYDLNEPAC